MPVSSCLCLCDQIAKCWRTGQWYAMVTKDDPIFVHGYVTTGTKHCPDLSQYSLKHRPLSWLDKSLELISKPRNKNNDDCWSTLPYKQRLLLCYMLAAAAAQSKYCKMLRYNPLEHCTECWCHPDHHHPLTTWTQQVTSELIKWLYWCNQPSMLMLNLASFKGLSGLSNLACLWQFNINIVKTNMLQQ